MSYILDALKKSDQERKRGDVPGLQTVHIPMASEQARPMGLYVFVVFLLLALAFVIGMMVTSQRSGPVNDLQPASVLQKQKQDFRPESEMQNPPSAMAVEKTLSKVVNRAQSDVKKARPAEVEPVNQALWTQNSKKVQETSIRGAVKSNPSVSVQDLSEVPYLHELADYQQQSIPEMSFAGHVYSSSASNRSIIINNRAISEGDEIMQELSVELITSNGVVFRFQDMLFKMDILQDWSFE